jgi:CAAX prenyl protease-like protein
VSETAGSIPSGAPAPAVPSSRFVLSTKIRDSRSLPYVAPFAVFMGFIALRSIYVLPDLIDQVLRVAIVGLVLIFVARPVIDLRAPRWPVSLLLGAAVFVFWVGPDLLFPGYRHHWLFENSILGAPKGALSVAGQTQPLVLTLRAVRAIVIVPIVEELFWRAWLMRWIVAPDFEKVPLGAYTPLAFWAVAILFASEHGSYWDVGLITGVIYNAWMVRSKSLGDLILTHAVTNACLCAYVIAAGKWEYWL